MSSVEKQGCESRRHASKKILIDSYLLLSNKDITTDHCTSVLLYRVFMAYLFEVYMRCVTSNYRDVRVFVAYWGFWNFACFCGVQAGAHYSLCFCGVLICASVCSYNCRVTFISILLQEYFTPTWTQEAYRLPCSKWPGGGDEGYLGGTPILTWPGDIGRGTYLGVHPILTWSGGTYIRWGEGLPTLGCPLHPHLDLVRVGTHLPPCVDKLKLLPSPILRVRAVINATPPVITNPLNPCSMCGKPIVNLHCCMYRKSTVNLHCCM